MQKNINTLYISKYSKGNDIEIERKYWLKNKILYKVFEK